MYTQLEGNITFGATDYSDQIHALRINTTRTSVAQKPTFANARESEAAGAIKETLTIMFKSSMAAASFWAELWDVIHSDTAELAFSGTLVDAVVSADNPEYSGTIVVTALETGGDVGSAREQTQTYPVTLAGITVSTTP